MLLQLQLDCNDMQCYLQYKTITKKCVLSVDSQHVKTKAALTE